MKNSVVFTFIGLLFFGFTASAQRTVRIAYVDMEYILENVPEYQAATAQLEKKVQKWKSEIEMELKRIEAMEQSLENEKALLTDELIEDRKEEIEFERQKVLDYQQERFGPNGDFMTQKMQLVQPIQDQVFIAVQEIAANRNYDLIFDKSADVVMLYADESLDVSDQVLRSIKRAASREEINSPREKEELLREEEKTVEESEAVSKREILLEQRRKEREALLEKRRQKRDSIKAARERIIEERKQKRQRKRDSIAAERQEKQEI